MKRNVETTKPTLREPEYQQVVDLAVDLPHGVRPCAAEYFVDWLIQYKGLPEEARENVISNLTVLQ